MPELRAWSDAESDLTRSAMRCCKWPLCITDDAVENPTPAVLLPTDSGLGAIPVPALWFDEASSEVPRAGSLTTDFCHVSRPDESCWWILLLLNGSCFCLSDDADRGWSVSRATFVRSFRFFRRRLHQSSWQSWFLGNLEMNNKSESNHTKKQIKHNGVCHMSNVFSGHTMNITRSETFQDNYQFFYLTFILKRMKKNLTTTLMCGILLTQVLQLR